MHLAHCTATPFPLPMTLGQETAGFVEALANGRVDRAGLDRALTRSRRPPPGW